MSVMLRWFECPECGRSGELALREGSPCPHCVAGRLRECADKRLSVEKLLDFPASGGGDPGGGALDPTPASLDARKDETLPSDISENSSGFNSYAQPPRGGKASRHEVGSKDDLGDDLSDGELPISVWVTVQRKTNVSRKMIRAWKAMGHRVESIQCGVCRQTCVLAQSTLQVIDDAWEKGLRYEAICEVCQDEKGVDEGVGGIVAVQAEELREVQRRALNTGVKGRVN